MRMLRRNFALTALALFLLLALPIAGCAAPTATPVPTTKPTPTEAATPTPPEGSTPTPTEEVTPVPSTEPTPEVSVTAGPSPTAAAYDPYASIPTALKGTTVKLLLWYSPSQAEKDLFANFTKKTGIKLATVITTYDAYQTKLAAMIAAKDPLDACLMYAPWYPTFITRNLLQPVDAFIDPKDTFWDYSMMQQNMWGGKYYGVASKGGSDMMVVLYNKTMFKNAGRITPRQLWTAKNWNWDTFLDAAKAMTTEVGGVKIYGFETPKNASFMLSTGADFAKYVDDPVTPIVHNLTDPRVLKGWQMVVDLRGKYGVSSGGSDVSLFTSGKCAMYTEGSWMLNSSPSNPLRSMTDEWDAVPFPSPKGSPAILPVTGKVWGMPIHSKNQKAAYYFLRYYLDPVNATVAPLAHADTQVVMDAMLKMNKCSDVVQGLMPSNDYWTLWSDLIYSADLNSTLNSWIPKMNAIIEQVINEIPKPD